MPSLHFAWSVWCCLALWPCLRSTWARALAVAHPVITLVAIVATANHYWLDALGGAVALLVGWLLGGVLGASAVDRVASWPRFPTRRALRPVPATGPPPSADAAAVGGDGHAASGRPPPAPVHGGDGDPRPRAPAAEGGDGHGAASSGRPPAPVDGGDARPRAPAAGGGDPPPPAAGAGDEHASARSD